MTTPTSTKILIGVVAAVAAYAIYFDQRRQRDPAFRRRLRSDREAAAKMMDEARRKNEADADRAVKAAMEALGLDDDKPPTTEEERQKYLTRQLQLGEQFLNQGPSHFRAAATCLFRALQVYPDPIKLLMAFQETVPPPVLDMVMQMMAQEGPPGTEAGGKRGPGGGREDEKIQEILD